MHACMYLCMDVYVYVGISSGVCMYVYIYIYIYIYVSAFENKGLERAPVVAIGIFCSTKMA